MNPRYVESILDGPFELTARPEPLPGDLRPAWGIALVLLVLGSSRGASASMQKLQLVANSARTRDSRRLAARVFEGSAPPDELPVRVEPWLNRAVALASGAGLIELVGGSRARLSNRGLEALKLFSDNGILAEEMAFIATIASRATEQAIERIARMKAAI